MENNSYERGRVYESVDDKSPSWNASQKLTEREFKSNFKFLSRFKGPTTKW